MKVSLADDDGAGCAQLLHQPGVACSNAIQIAVEMNTARGGRAGEIEKVLNRDGQTPERGATIAKRTAATTRHRFGAGRLCTRPRRILPDVGVATCILVHVREGRLGQSGWLEGSGCERAAKIADGPGRCLHKGIFIRSSNPPLFAAFVAIWPSDLDQRVRLSECV
jgi:hypothetical protein